MFLGEYEHSLDGKGRLTIPVKLRHEFGDGLVVTRGLDGCLFIYTLQGFDAYVATLNQLPPDKKSSRSFTRFVFSAANKLFPDKQGRILLPARLRIFAGLDGDVIIIGANHRLEVWAADRWQAVLEEVERDAENVVEELPDLRIAF
jgi:MraZ protein